jgi:hypothetical protein
VIYNLLFQASAATLLEIARDPRHLGAEIGFFSVLHTWNSQLQHHPHVHCVAAAGGLATDHSHWISSRHRFFLPVKVLSRVFRGKFVAGLKSAFHQDRLAFYGHLAPLAESRNFAAWLRSLFRHDWVVYAKPPFGGPEHALRYLSGYTHRAAISNRRLVALEQGNVTFRWRDSAHANKQRLLTLPVDEFLRFLLHLLPRGFMRIRNFGFLANRRRASLLPLSFQLLANSADISAPTTSPPPDRAGSSTCWKCPVCGGSIHTVERLSATQLLIRSPPLSPLLCRMSLQLQPRSLRMLRHAQCRCVSSRPRPLQDQLSSPPGLPQRFSNSAHSTTAIDRNRPSHHPHTPSASPQSDRKYISTLGKRLPSTRSIRNAPEWRLLWLMHTWRLFVRHEIFRWSGSAVSPL